MAANINKQKAMAAAQGYNIKGPDGKRVSALPSGSEGGSSELSAADKQRVMLSEREAMRRLLTGAMADDAAAVRETLLSYVTAEDSPAACLAQFRDGRGRTALHFAAQSHAVQVLKLVRELALGSAASDEDAAALRELADRGDEGGVTSLACCCMNAPPPSVPAGNLPLAISLLLELGASPGAAAGSGATPLHHAAGAGSLPLLTLAALPEPLLSAPSDAGTPLHWAAGSVHPSAPAIISLLCRRGADPNALDPRGLPPLILAAAGCRDGCASELVAGGADVGAILTGGVTVAHIAADNGLAATLAALAASEGGRNLFGIANDKGETPAELAAENGYKSCFRILMGEEGKKLDEGGLSELMGRMKVEQEAKAAARPPPPPEKKGEELPLVKPGEEEKWSDPLEVAAAEECGMALEKAKACKAEDREKAEAHKKLGNGFFGKKSYAKAIEEYSAAVDLYGADRTYYSNRSACHAALKDDAAALADAVRCRVADPAWQKGAYRLAAARLALGRHEDAAVAAWEGVSLEPGSKEAEALKGLMRKAVAEGKKAEGKKKKK
ncbi:hypothetical protein TeGR_g4970 [Tetraparma gracilis]|uniref:Uncharacterized protein n=1 Tax=Tetraparma gracilis TaxID=2962635 RepID=A0ABQ6MQL8_9STRA|nr:hypothetical protein TeGR_g4970 [Tetraparma gracilis]